MRMRKDVFTTYETAQFCQVNPFSIRNWIESNKLPAYRTPGGHRRVKREDLIKFLQNHKMPVPKELVDPGIRIMIIDNDEQFVNTIVNFLENLEVDIVIEKAANGFDAGWLIRIFSPEALIISLDMPGLDGVIITSNIKNEETLNNVRILAVTENYSHELLERIMTAGASYCFSKPVNLNEFRRVIKKHVFEI